MKQDGPHPGEVYSTPDGRPMLYVRSEKRPGDDAPRHLFVVTRNRVVMDRWEDDVPAELELRLDPEAVARANEASWRIRELEAEVGALAAALKAAVSVVPVPVANDLRRVFREHKAQGLAVIA